MIAQQELQKLIRLSVREKLELARVLIDSSIEAASANGQQVSQFVEETDQPSAGARWLMEMAGRYSGGPGDTAERADEICEAELGARSEYLVNR